jgi:ADP-ribose pyrophosphatase YjhB (NUDIX family)
MNLSFYKMASSMKSSSSIRDQVFDFGSGQVSSIHGQNCMELQLTRRTLPRGFKSSMSSYYLSDETNQRFMVDVVIPRIKALSNDSNPLLLGPLYYRKGEIYDYQCSVTGTAKAGENEMQAMQREMAEEMGLAFKQGAKFERVVHSFSARGGLESRACVTFFVHASQLCPVDSTKIEPLVPFFNIPDLVLTADDGRKQQRKIQVFIFGEYKNFKWLLSQQTMKPVKVTETQTKFYDADILGLTLFSLEHMAKRFFMRD